MIKLQNQAALRQAYETQMLEKDNLKRQSRAQNDNFAEEYKCYLDGIDNSRKIPNSSHGKQDDYGQNYGTGLQIGGSSNMPARESYDKKQALQNNVENVYTGLPIGYNNNAPPPQRLPSQYSQHKENINYEMDARSMPKSKVEINREKQMQDKEYTGFNIGQIGDRGKFEKGRQANNYHAMLDEQVAIKREANRMKNATDAALVQDSLDYQMQQVNRSQLDRQRQVSFI